MIKMTGYWQLLLWVFIEQAEVEYNKKSKKERGPLTSHLDLLCVANKVFITVSSETSTRNIERSDMSQYYPPEISRFIIIGLISLMNSFAALTRGRRVCLLEFATVLKQENDNKNSSREIQRLQMNPPWERGLITLIIWLFPCFIFLRQR